MKARVLSRSESGIKEAGRVLASGGLVAFPTETVYGLGANALDEKAVLRIFETKGRPLTDPLIVHVPSREAALSLIQLSEAARYVFERLTDAFWPGPLTLIAPARPELPQCLSAGTNTLGVRCPSHPLARKLLQTAAVPVAAPSANLFGHVSPTTARHVLDDLGDADIFVLDGESRPSPNEPFDEYDTHISCQHGIESTVCKLEEDEHSGLSVRIFRRGAVAASDLAAILDQCEGVSLRDAAISTKSKLVENDLSKPQVSPGQLLTHYAPRLPAVLTTLATDWSSSGKNESLRAAVVVDFNGSLAPLKSSVLAYRDLAPDGNAAKAATDLFSTLRWAEDIPGAERVLIVDLSAFRTGNDLLAGVADRLYRAASGRHLVLPSSS